MIRVRIKNRIKKLLRALGVYAPVYRCWKQLRMLCLPWRRRRFLGYFDAFLRDLALAAPGYGEKTVVFFGHMGDERKRFYDELASRLEAGEPGRRVLFVDRGAAEPQGAAAETLDLLRKHGLLRMAEEPGNPADWDSRWMRLPWPREMRALMAAKPWLRHAAEIVRGAFGGDTAKYSPEGLVCLYYRCFDALLTSVNVEQVNIWNGFRFNHWLLAEMCRERGIPVSYLEFGALPGTLVFDRRGQMGESAPAVDYAAFRALSVTEEDLARADEVIDYLHGSGLNRNKQPNATRAEKRALAKLRPDRPVLLFAGQWDMASGMIPYTEHTRQYHSPVYKSSREALLALAALAEKHDWNLLFKPHPNVREEYRSSELPPNVIMVKSGNLNTLIDRSDAVATILSTTAYVSLIRGRAAVMLGYNQLRGKGCAYEAYTADEVEGALTAALTVGCTEEQKAAFRRHVAQLNRYYLYRDGVERDGPVYGRPPEELAAALTAPADEPEIETMKEAGA